MIIEVVGKEIEEIKGDFESYLNGLNMVGEISYSQYSELYDEGTKQIQKAYELGKKANEWHFVKDELPELYKDVLVVFPRGDCDVKRLTNHNEWVSRGSWCSLTDVIAWKEIVLPKETE